MRSFGSGTPLAGRYVLVDQLSSGPDATVWRGLDDVLGRPVAIKMFTSAAHHAEDRAWIHQRARTAARLSHPHAAAVYDFGDAPGRDQAMVPYVVMELLDGVPLAGRLAGGRLPWRLSVRTAAEVASALATAHARGVVHGDLSPDAVLLTDVGAKLIGFAGPARAPRVEFTAADDVRALGVLLGRTLLGVEPHAGTTVEAFASMRRLPTDVPAVCLACLALRAGDRPSAEQVARRLAAVVTQFALETDGGEELPVSPVPSWLALHRSRHAVPMRRLLAAGPRRSWNRAQAGLATAGVLALLTLSGLASGVGEDLISAATGRSPRGADVTVTGAPRPGGGPAGDTTPYGNVGGGAPGPSGLNTLLPGAPGASGYPTALPSTSASPSGGAASSAEALAQLRAAVDDGRATGQIAPEVAAEIDEQIDEVARKMMPSSVARLQRDIDEWTRAGDIEPERAAILRAAIATWVAAS